VLIISRLRKPYFGIIYLNQTLVIFHTLIKIKSGNLGLQDFYKTLTINELEKSLRATKKINSHFKEKNYRTIEREKLTN